MDSFTTVALCKKFRITFDTARTGDGLNGYGSRVTLRA
jgi:hypothetical protein